MRITPRLIVPPTVEPVSLDQAKAQLTLDASFTDDDALIASLISAARDHCERKTHRAFFTQKWQVTLDEFPLQTRLDQAYRPSPNWIGDWYRETAIRLPMPLCQSVESVTYVDDAGIKQTLPTTSYRVDDQSEPASVIPIAGAYWPLTSGLYPGAITVTYTCASYGDGPESGLFPPSITAAILLLVSHWYSQREAASPLTAKAIEFGVDALLRPFVVRP